MDRLKLIGTKSNRDGIGARVQVKTGELMEIREVDGGNGYAGQSTRRVHFGLGAATRIDSVQINWPSGHVDRVAVPINRISVIEEGIGIVK